MRYAEKKNALSPSRLRASLCSHAVPITTAKLSSQRLIPADRRIVRKQDLAEGVDWRDVVQILANPPVIQNVRMRLENLHHQASADLIDVVDAEQCACVSRHEEVHSRLVLHELLRIRVAARRPVHDARRPDASTLRLRIKERA